MENLKELQLKFVEFVNQSEGEFADFYLTKTGSAKLASLVGGENVNFFEVIGAHSSHSLICYWEHESGLAVNQRPVVWLDSEGSPNSVFAPGFKDFISLLPYNSSLIYDIISSWIHYKEDPETIHSPKQLFTGNALKKRLYDAQARYAAYGKFMDWLNKNNIPICKNPVTMIGETIDFYPDLTAWLSR